MKRKPKPPKFYVSVALKDVANDRTYYDKESVREEVMSRLFRLSNETSLKRLAPLPIGLEGSLYDPKMLQLRSDEEFKDIYMNGLEGTVEEDIAVIVRMILGYDCEYFSKCHVCKPDCDSPADFSLGDVCGTIGKCADRLHSKYSKDVEYQNIEKMLSDLYPYMLQFARNLKLDLNAFLQWNIRYSNLK